MRLRAALEIVEVMIKRGKRVWNEVTSARVRVRALTRVCMRM